METEKSSSYFIIFIILLNDQNDYLMIKTII